MRAAPVELTDQEASALLAALIGAAGDSGIAEDVLLEDYVRLEEWVLRTRIDSAIHDLLMSERIYIRWDGDEWRLLSKEQVA